MEAEIAYLFFFVVPASVILCLVARKFGPSRPTPFGFDLRKLLFGDLPEHAKHSAGSLK